MQSLLDPAVLFLRWACLRAWCGRTGNACGHLQFLSIYLLMALGLKGGFALAASGFTASVASSLGLAVLLAVVVPPDGLRAAAANAVGLQRRGGGSHLWLGRA
jgi:hypothetical protein